MRRRYSACIRELVTEGLIAFALKQAKLGMPVAEVVPQDWHQRCDVLQLAALAHRSYVS